MTIQVTANRWRYCAWPGTKECNEVTSLAYPREIEGHLIEPNEIRLDNRLGRSPDTPHRCTSPISRAALYNSSRATRFDLRDSPPTSLPVPIAALNRTTSHFRIGE
jgi:hypothetical protein